jgi:hypothetical protein
MADIHLTIAGIIVPWLAILGLLQVAKLTVTEIADFILCWARERHRVRLGLRDIVSEEESRRAHGKPPSGPCRKSGFSSSSRAAAGDHKGRGERTKSCDDSVTGTSQGRPRM